MVDKFEDIEHLLNHFAENSVCSQDIEPYQMALRHYGEKILSCAAITTPITIIDIESDLSGISRNVLLKRYSDEELIKCHVSAKEAPETRIIMICSLNSIRPLGCSSSLLTYLILNCKFPLSFLDIFLAFRGKPRNTEAGSGSMTVGRNEYETFDTQYILTFPEGYGIKVSQWTLRQIGVYHRYEKVEGRSTWVFLHAMPTSVAQRKIESTIAQSSDFRQIHAAVLSSYVHNWKLYIDTLGDEVEEMADVAFTMNFKSQSHYERASHVLSKLQHYQDVIAPLSSRLTATRATILKLQEINHLFSADQTKDSQATQMFDDILKRYDAQIIGYLDGVHLLAHRAEKIIEALTVAQNLQNQAVTLNINDNMLHLTRHTVDDSVTVRIVTLVTLIYLPASFVASLLGTNLFVFETASGAEFSISPRFWVFVVATVPLTILTVGSWFGYVRYQKRRDRAGFQKENDKHE